jgi:hypothetical protein
MAAITDALERGVILGLLEQLAPAVSAIEDVVNGSTGS